jgi:hypothetical protein
MCIPMGIMYAQRAGMDRPAHGRHPGAAAAHARGGHAEADGESERKHPKRESARMTTSGLINTDSLCYDSPHGTTRRTD